MEINLFQRIQKGLLEKQQNLNNWLNSAQPEQIEACCGSQADESVHPHLEVLSSALQEIETGTFGRCEVCHETVSPVLLEMDYTASICLDHYNADERRQLENELEFSSSVQRALLPQPAPIPSNVDLSAFTRPANIVSGDTYDFFTFQDGAQGVAIADAVGHGVSAGLLISSVQTALRLLVPENVSPAVVLDRINQLLLHNHHFTTFATVFLASFDAQRRRLVYSSAGQNPPLLYSPKTGTLTQLLPTGPAVGLVEFYQQRAEELHLEPGDLLLLYTDGITEAHNHQREEFGLDRLATLVRQAAGLPSVEVVQIIRQALEAFLEGKPPEDDTTLMAINIR